MFSTLLSIKNPIVTKIFQLWPFFLLQPWQHFFKLNKLWKIVLIVFSRLLTSRWLEKYLRKSDTHPPDWHFLHTYIIHMVSFFWLAPLTIFSWKSWFCRIYLLECVFSLCFRFAINILTENWTFHTKSANIKVSKKKEACFWNVQCKSAHLLFLSVCHISSHCCPLCFFGDRWPL